MLHRKRLNLIRKFAGVLVALVLVHSIADAQELRPMSPVDMVEMPRLSSPRLSPDGRYMIYLRSQTDWKENETFDRYVLVDLEKDQEIPTFAAAKPDEDYGTPVWSPDSLGFVTLLKREKDKNSKSKDKPKRQAFYFDVRTSTLKQLTVHKSNVGNVQWAPDGKGFYFLSQRPWSAALEKALKDDFAILPYEVKSPSELWYFDIAKQTSRKIISGDFYLRSYKLSPDGSKIIHMRANGPNGDDRHSGELWSHDLASGTAKQLTSNGYAESSPEISPDGRQFAYIATVNEKGEGYYEDNLFIQTVGDEKPALLLPDTPMEILDFAWGAEKGTLYILGNTGLRVQIYQYDIQSEALTQLTFGDHDIDDWSFNPKTKTHSYIAAPQANPGEVFTLNGVTNPKQISQDYKDWPERFLLPKQEAFLWKGRGGIQLEGLLVYPIGYQSGERFPLVTITHGGPRDSSRFGAWNTSRSVPVLAGQGYGVFLPNHRGGTGYGDKFMRDMVGGYFKNAHLDVMSGIDALIKVGLADPDQLIKQGWSAGGHMTNKLITFTNRFKAASSGAGASDWVSMYGESDVRYRRTPWFGGAPWEKKPPLRTYQKNSPLKDAWKITTPTLFWNGKSDVRVPPTQGILMYRGAKAAGVETRLYLAPDQPHGFKVPGYKLFKINTELAWYAKHLGRNMAEPVMPDMSVSETVGADAE